MLSRQPMADKSMHRFLDCEQWRKDFGVEAIVKDFNYVEKPKVFEYYPQYYHKTDKAGQLRYSLGSNFPANF